MDNVVYNDTHVVNVRVANIRQHGYNNLKEFVSDKNNVYIGRKGIVFIDSERFPKTDSPWANPYKIDEKNGVTREKVLKKYKKYIIKKIESGELNLEDLRGKSLGCWCAPELCHGDILIELLAKL